MVMLIPIVGFIVIAIFIRLCAGGFDGERVESYIRELGGELVDKSWDPLGPGWFGEKNARIYEIVYRDNRKTLHRAHVKTSMMSGVYLTNDKIIEEASPDAIEDEKAQLRKRLEELENQSS
jgi:hypothetical protein